MKKNKFKKGNHANYNTRTFSYYSRLGGFCFDSEARNIETKTRILKGNKVCRYNKDKVKQSKIIGLF